MPRFSIVALLAFATAVFAQSPFVGTWKLDVERTKFTSGDPGTNTTLVIHERGHDLWVNVTATMADRTTISLVKRAFQKGKTG